jgi:peptidoglycan DL-endopeptidase CwlO
MSPNHVGRHRAPRTPLHVSASRLLPGAAPVARGSAAFAAAGGLILAAPTAGQAAPGAVAPQTAPAAVPSAAMSLVPPAALSAAPSSPVAIAPALPLPANPVIVGPLRQGSRGESVRVVQRIVGTSADGVFGPKTHAAVKGYQSRKGLLVDGIVGPQTSRAMGLSYGTTSSRTTTTASRTTTRAPLSSPSTSGVLGVAAQYTGIMYRYGGSSPSTGFDCSGYTQFVFGKVGKSLPRTAEGQRQATTRVSNPQPGDLVFFGAPAWHVGIYAGNGMMYDSGRSGLPTQLRKVFSGASSYGRVG